MGTAEKHTRYTYQEYLALEEAADFKSEYYDGEIYAMSGGTRDHNLIGTNVCGELRAALKGKDCSVFSSELRVRIDKAESGVYPDGMVIYGPEAYYQDRADVITNPMVIIEVLSESTKAWDYKGKFRKYEMLPSLQEYVLIEQKEPQVDIFRRNDQGFWVLERYDGLATGVVFHSIGVTVPMKEIYYRVQFPA